MIRRPVSVVVVTMLATACVSNGDEVPVVSGPDLPGAEIITSSAEVTMSEGETSEVAVSTQVRFGPQFIRPSPNGPGRLGILLAEVPLGPLSIRVESNPDVMTTVSNTGGQAVGGVSLESSFAIDGEARSDVVISAGSDAEGCVVSGAIVSCPIGMIAASDTTTAVIEVRSAALLEGTLTVTTRVRADIGEETGASPGPEDAPPTPAETVTSPPGESPSP